MIIGVNLYNKEGRMGQKEVDVDFIKDGEGIDDS
jgi:hypothetical protein